MISGNRLIELGYKPAPWFSQALKVLKEDSDEETIRSVCDALLPEEVETIEVFEKPVPYKTNIKGVTLEEVENISNVKEAMNEIMRTPTVVAGAVMPDACPVGGKNIPVGAIAVTKNTIHPSWHSADMCCSVYCTDFGDESPKDVLDAAYSITHFGAGGRRGYKDFSNFLEGDLYNRILGNHFTKDYIEKACKHLGTQGDGNHFLFVGVSEQTGRTMMVTHHGSRGFGASVYKKGMATAEKFRRKISPSTDKSNAWIPFNEVEGKLYWEAIQIVRDWTKLNHSVLHNKTLDKVGATGNHFWNEHNSVFKDGDLFYHAKGATPLDEKFLPDSFEGLRLIPLNMSQPILVVKGSTNENNIGFAPHGAGRNISRTAHKKKNELHTKEEIFKKETEGLDVRFFSGNIDVSELPSAYKNAEQVQNQMEEFGLGEVVDRIMPYGCIMAGEFKKKY